MDGERSELKYFCIALFSTVEFTPITESMMHRHAFVIFCDPKPRFPLIYATLWECVDAAKSEYLPRIYLSAMSENCLFPKVRAHLIQWTSLNNSRSMVLLIILRIWTQLLAYYSECWLFKMLLAHLRIAWTRFSFFLITFLFFYITIENDSCSVNWNLS